MRAYFYQLADYLPGILQADEQGLLWLAAESSDFVRINHNALRQPGHVAQTVLSLELVAAGRHACSTLNLTGNSSEDYALMHAAVKELRQQLPELSPDPHLLINPQIQNTEYCKPDQLIASADMLGQILAAGQGYDLVGLLTSGQVWRGFANSNGQRNWYETSTFNFDWSLFLNADKAVKSNYAGFVWNATEFQHKFAEAKQRLSLLARTPVTVAPGEYRVYLTPTALNELICMLNWNGLSEKALRTRQSSLRRLQTGEVSLHPAIHLCEDSQLGVAPAFQAKGFIKPDQVELIRAGKLLGSMISPGSAQEYGLKTNGADEDESAVAMHMQAGNLPHADILKQLNTGIYISNLWYLNYSDRASCRLTGMTRFASFWVENGEIKAPLNVMRFDDSLFRILGEQLQDLTQERELIMDDRSYGERHTGGNYLPGALIKSMRFVL